MKVHIVISQKTVYEALTTLVILHIVIRWLTKFLFHIMVVLGSYLDSETGYQRFFVVFTLSLQANARIVPQSKAITASFSTLSNSFFVDHPTVQHYVAGLSTVRFVSHRGLYMLLVWLAPSCL